MVKTGDRPASPGCILRDPSPFLWSQVSLTVPLLTFYIFLISINPWLHSAYYFHLDSLRCCKTHTTVKRSGTAAGGGGGGHRSSGGATLHHPRDLDVTGGGGGEEGDGERRSTRR